MLQRKSTQIPKHDLTVEGVLLDGLSMSLGKIHSLERKGVFFRVLDYFGPAILCYEEYSGYLEDSP